MPIQKINSAVEALEKVKAFETYKKRDHIHQQLGSGRLNPINCILSITITYQLVLFGHFAPFYG